MTKGIFIVIEGSDGSGKSTHFNLLLDYLKGQGKEVATYKFPQYDKPSSYFSVQYLNGAYGDANELGAYKPSLFYALDRFEASKSIRDDLAAGKVVLCDRFVGSNMAHQGQKLDNASERHAYFDWIYNLEFGILDIPQPDLNLVLIMPPEVAYKLMSQRDKRSYTEQQRDIHEADKNHLTRAVKTYKELCERFPDTFTRVECCTNQDTLRPIDEIQAAVRKSVEERLTHNNFL
jgi:dTMP kinase